MITAYEIKGNVLKAYVCVPLTTPRPPKKAEEKMTKRNRYPKGWDEARVKHILNHYENQDENEAIAEDEAAWEDESQTFVEVPKELVNQVRELILRKAS